MHEPVPARVTGRENVVTLLCMVPPASVRPLALFPNGPLVEATTLLLVALKIPAVTKVAPV